MKSKELNNPVVLSEGVEIDYIEGISEYIEDSDFKKFSEITLSITSPKTDDLNIISFTREQYEGVAMEDGSFNTTLWRTDFKTQQLVGGITEEKIKGLLCTNEDAVIEAVNEFIDDFESQNMD